MTRYAKDFSEGDPCPMQDCNGTLEYPPVKDCCCHIAPPCRACTDNDLECSICGWEVEDIDDD